MPAVATLVSLGLTACSMAPDYAPPQMAVPPAFKEVGGWSKAAPSDDAPRGDWWKAFDDPVLDMLIDQAVAHSPTLEAALARYDQARAVVRVEGSSRYPQVNLTGAGARERVSGNRPIAVTGPQTYDVVTLGTVLDYEIDLWGRIRNRVRAARADASASAADLLSARLNITAATADAYIRLRGLDAQSRLLGRSVDAFSRAYDLTNTRHEGGVVSGIDVNRARTILSNARAQISAVAAERAATEHELAALTGVVASDFAVVPVDGIPQVKSSPAAVPSVLLQRRPDIAAAERRMFAANARVGVARAAMFPTLTLGLSAGFQATRGDLFSSPSSFWGLGPLSAIAALLDGGRRRAGVALSRAEYDEATAAYRDIVLTAFRQVEDALAASRYLAAQEVDQRDAATAANRTSDLALTRYRDGAADYLEVVTAQADALISDRATLDIQTQRARAAVALVRALGGDRDGAPPADPPT